MQRLFRNLALPLSLVLFTACGGGDDDDGAADAGAAPDGNSPGGICAPAAVLDTYPASFDGDVLGSGADMNVESGVCADERSHFSQEGEDQVIQLNGLTPGAGYVVEVDAASDLAFYVVTDCTGSDPVAGECLLFADEELGQASEIADFTAPANGTAFVIVDHFAPAEPLTNGAYTISILEPQCQVDADCNGTPDTPFCEAFECVECANSFQCESDTAPVCDGATNTCVAGTDNCTPDDTTESGDDGPAGAATLTAPTEGNPTVVDANICSDPLTEVDFYTIDLAQDANVVFSLDWTAVAGAPDLDLVLIDGDGFVIDSSFNNNPEVLILEEADAGTYYLAVSKFEPNGTPVAASVGYTLTASVPECQDSFDCETIGAPVCGPALTCVAGSDTCTGDTDDDISANDGPAAATSLTLGAPAVNGAICNSPGSERDYYSVTIADGASLSVNLGYDENGAADLDVAVLNSDGDTMGFTFWQNPETVDLTFLPAGTYFIEVSYFGAAVTVAHPYSISVSSVGGACTADSDCDDVFRTQILRGDCNVGTGACEAIDGAGALAQDAPCDSGDDCTSGVCSYMLFQEDAGTSVCTINCNASSECTTAHGAGFSCTVPFTNNFCHPDCGSNLECGVNTNSETLDTNEPWDYLLCNAGTCELDN